MEKPLELPIIDLSSPDRVATAHSIRQACIDYGFFYLVNHGVEEELLQRTFDESKKLFSLPLEEKMKLSRKEYRGYTPLYAENLDPSSSSKGDSKETFYVGPLDDRDHLNQWPSEEVLPSWRTVIGTYHKKVMTAGIRLVSLVALALNLDEDFFEKVRAVDRPMPVLRLLHYPGELCFSEDEFCGASAHSDYGMITLLATDGVRGLQASNMFLQGLRCEYWGHDGKVDKLSTLHRVIATGQERYSMAFFLDPNPDCMVECLKSCCSEASPPRFPPIRSQDYLDERFRLTYLPKFDGTP
ncbi:hypothetical protein RJ640_012897, partial [Escallonia rubra]